MGKKDTFSTDTLTDSAYYILLSLLEPRHGYAIMQYIVELTDDEFTIGPATMYTLIKKFLKHDLIQLYDEQDRRKLYVVTDSGRKAVTADLERRQAMVNHGHEVIQMAEGKEKNEN
ncbi:PadR family transcriptional regulator [Alteribacillus sp. HJP-4]|uniref:PadR family transcriptional regulator n=1 Tax=Alteribacillus sp. HJP-4 TaxID=2775394 RepID=UPI0035CCCD94